ncbi:NADAR family protein [Affinibrenneria salicis]|uniref:N-glycosidase YbiA n=1 Tax=Affinibrenneria salicis TaxID=2590031 RepID=A0A5J5FWG8_9GAMM|nr:NADAR family protein [Affinibrenneria salicis]KAA8998122.1 NADAR family protein [Affinibrenneria salicis]
MTNDTQHREVLCRRYRAGEKLKFVFFWGHQPAKSGVTASCFSQWYGAPFEVDSLRYPSAEHFMMAEKARLFADDDTCALVLKAPNPGAAKALGRQVRGFDDALWCEHRFAIVVRANMAKFSQHPELADYLVNTGSRILVEASPVDRVWGIGLAQDDERVANPLLWRGHNLLGFALMQVREQLASS